MLLSCNVHHQEEKEAAQSIINDMSLALKGRAVQVVFFLCKCFSLTSWLLFFFMLAIYTISRLGRPRCIGGQLDVF
jgi:hypothetical protein